MASDWQRRGGKTLDGVGRALARKGLDILDVVGVTIEGDYLNGSRSVVAGEVRDTVEATLGTRKFKEICKKYTVLENVHYCQSGLSFVHGYRYPQKAIPASGLGDAVKLPSFINHDYLVLEVGYGMPGSDMTKVFIRAEKRGHPAERAGILITVDPNFEDKEQDVRLFTVKCSQKEMRLPNILAILGEHSPEYSLRDQNCWQYTRKTTKRLLEACKEASKSDAEEIARLQQEEDTVEARIAKNHIKNGFKSVLKIFTRQNNHHGESSLVF